MNRTIRRALKITAIASAILLLTIGGMFAYEIMCNDLKLMTDARDTIIFGYDRQQQSFVLNQPKTFDFDGVDGPYIVGTTVYAVDADSRFYATPLDRSAALTVTVSNRDADRFTVRLRDTIAPPPDTFAMPRKLLAISDIEGNFDAFAGLLQRYGVIDNRFDWSYGDGHLALVGDFVDRGDNVTAVLWLIYKLEEQAEKQGGRVHYILGNHELMNMQGKPKYNVDKYKRVSQEISGLTDVSDAVRFLYSDSTELGRWLNTRNGVVRVGRTLFVHAGISPDMLAHRLDIAQLNALSRANWRKDLYNEPGDDAAANTLLGRTGLFWYRGLIRDYKYYSIIDEPSLDSILQFYGVDRIVFGHTVCDDITPGFGGKAICIDVKHGDTKTSKCSCGLLFEADRCYKVNAAGGRTRL